MAIGRTNAFTGGGKLKFGYINSAGNVQPIKFSGTTASDDGSPLTGLSKKIFNTGKNEPVYNGGTLSFTPKIYKITSVSGTTYKGVKATGYSNGSFTFSSTADTLSASSAPTTNKLYCVINGAIYGSAIASV